MKNIKITIDNIKITIDNTAKIEAALAAVNGKAVPFAISKYAEIEMVVVAAEKMIADKNMSKTESMGTIYCFSPAGPSAKGYKYSVKSTAVKIQRTSSGWNLIEVQQINIYPKRRCIETLIVSEKQAKIIQKKTLKNVIVKKRH
jgi:hypothetical protein